MGRRHCEYRRISEAVWMRRTEERGETVISFGLDVENRSSDTELGTAYKSDLPSFALSLCRRPSRIHRVISTNGRSPRSGKRSEPNEPFFFSFSDDGISKLRGSARSCLVSSSWARLNVTFDVEPTPDQNASEFLDQQPLSSAHARDCRARASPRGRDRFEIILPSNHGDTRTHPRQHEHRDDSRRLCLVHVDPRSLWRGTEPVPVE